MNTIVLIKELAEKFVFEDLRNTGGKTKKKLRLLTITIENS